MSLLLFLFCFAMCWIALHFLIKDIVQRHVEREVARRLEQQGELARRHHDAVHDIRDELRRTSHQLIATALESGTTQHVVIDHDDLIDRPRR